MICTKCFTDGVYNEVLGKGFYYCRTCKCEIELQQATEFDDPRLPLNFSVWSDFYPTTGYIDERIETLKQALKERKQ